MPSFVTQNAPSGSGTQPSQSNKEQVKAHKRKHEYAPKGYRPPPGTIRIHTKDPIKRVDNLDRVIRNWTRCLKPRPNGGNIVPGSESHGCRTGHFGYLVRENGVLRTAFVCKRVVCDYAPPDSDGEGCEIENDGEHEELGGGDFEAVMLEADQNRIECEELDASEFKEAVLEADRSRIEYET